MGRRLTLLLCAMATMVVVSAGAALALVIIGTNADDNCATPITGQPAPTNQADDITLAGGADECNGRGGPDEIYGDSGEDVIMGGAGTDSLYGGGGQTNDVDGQGGSGDFVNVVDNDNNDVAAGGAGGGDICAVDDPTEADATCEIVRHARP